MKAISVQPNVFIKEQLHLKLEYLNHAEISGNKLRKLTYNLKEAKKRKYDSILTFGGAYSNHIAAVAAAGETFGFRTIGVIRGEEIKDQVKINPTLSYATERGMTLHFVSREAYRRKTEADSIENLKALFKKFYLLPEGGTNALAVRGCEEILGKNDTDFDYVCCPVGTGGTIAGLINSSYSHQQVLGFPVLKGNFLENEVKKYTGRTNWQLINDYHFGGYAKINRPFIEFINGFKNKFGIPIDPIYTGKMLFGIFDLMEKGYFPENAKILAVHTGGLQGISGMNTVLKRKKWPLII